MASVSPMAVSPMASDADAQGTAADDTSVRLQEGVTDAQDAALVAHRHEFNAGRPMCQMGRPMCQMGDDPCVRWDDPCVGAPRGVKSHRSQVGEDSS